MEKQTVGIMPYISYILIKLLKTKTINKTLLVITIIFGVIVINCIYRHILLAEVLKKHKYIKQQHPILNKALMERIGMVYESTRDPADFINLNNENLPQQKVVLVSSILYSIGVTENFIDNRKELHSKVINIQSDMGTINDEEYGFFGKKTLNNLSSANCKKILESMEENNWLLKLILELPISHEK